MTSLTTWKIDGEVKLRMGEDGLAAYEPMTVIQAFQKSVEKNGNDPAVHFKVEGEWQHLTFQQYYDRCVLFAKALMAVGVERFDGVGIIGFNAPEWTTAMLGGIMAGCVGAGIYTTNQAHACEYNTKHAGCSVVVCDGMKQLEKFLAIQSNLPKLKALVMYNADVPEGLQSRVPVYGFEDFMKLGKDVDDAKVTERMEMQKPGQCCSLIYTSGTTGDPKAVMISHDNASWTAESVAEAVGSHTVSGILDNHTSFVSFLPLSHIAAQIIDIFINVKRGTQIFFAQPDAMKGSLGVTLKEVRPTIFVAVPRVYEKLAEKLWSISSQTQGLKRLIATWAKGKGTKKMEMAQYDKSGGEPCGFGIAHSLVLGKIKEALGLDRCEMCINSAAPISREVIEYFGALDIHVFDLFGESEASGPQTLNAPGMWKIGTAGRSMDGCKTSVVPETEELIFNGRNIMMGYLGSEEETKATVDEDGWMHSGDCGSLDEDGFMTVTGRIKEIIITAGGENVPPVLIEHEIKEQLPILSNVMVIGDKRRFLTCVFTLRTEVDSTGCPTDKLDSMALGVCAEIGSTATTVAEAKACSKVQQYLADGLERANAKATSRAQKVGKFEVLDTDFWIGGGEMTPTLKLKRRVVLEKNHDLIERMYAA